MAPLPLDDYETPTRLPIDTKGYSLSSGLALDTTLPPALPISTGRTEAPPPALSVRSSSAADEIEKQALAILNHPVKSFFKGPVEDANAMLAKAAAVRTEEQKQRLEAAKISVDWKRVVVDAEIRGQAEKRAGFEKLSAEVAKNAMTLSSGSPDQIAVIEKGLSKIGEELGVPGAVKPLIAMARTMPDLAEQFPQDAPYLRGATGLAFKMRLPELMKEGPEAVAKAKWNAMTLPVSTAFDANARNVVDKLKARPEFADKPIPFDLVADLAATDGPSQAYAYGRLPGGASDAVKQARELSMKRLQAAGVTTPDVAAKVAEEEATRAGKAKTAEEKAAAEERGRRSVAGPDLDKDVKAELQFVGATDPATATQDQIKQATERVKKVKDLEEPVRTQLRGLGLSPADASPAQIKQAKTDIEQARVRVAAAQGESAAKITADREQNAPLDEKAPLWLNPKTGEPASPAWSLKDVKSRGYVPVTDSGLNATATAKAALSHLTEYRQLAPRLLAEGGRGVAADILAVQGNRVRLAALRKAGDPNVKRLDALFGAIATLARATGDTANIAVAERQMLRELVVTDGDTIQSATDKLDQAERILRAVVAGRNVPQPAAPASRGGASGGETPDDRARKKFLNKGAGTRG